MTASERTPSRSEDAHRPCNRGIGPFRLSLATVMGASAAIRSRFESIRHSIGGIAAKIAVIMAVIMAVGRRVLSIVNRIARIVDGYGPVAA